jgi:ABC-type Fe3+-hydroxamate transport system substrate-binding protein
VSAAPPRRIVSLVPSTTESVCAFGAGERLVGCTRYCVEPPAALVGIARIGGTKNPKREAIAALTPDLVLANAEENRAEDLAWLAARVPVLAQTPRTVAEAATALGELAAALGCGAALAAAVGAAVTAPAQALPPLRAYYAIWRKPWMTVNGDTYVHDVMARAGFANVAADAAARYPEMAPEEAVGRGVEVVLLASEPWTFDDAQREELANARAFGDARVVRCDGRDFSWHGVHVAAGLAAARRLRAQLG